MSSRRSRIRPRTLLALVATTVLLAGCGDSGTADDAGAKPAGDTKSTTTFAFPKDEIVDMTGQPTVTISAIDNSLEPRYVEVSVGTRVIWQNNGRNPHDILPAVEGAFASASAAEMPAGASHIVTFDQAGDFPYYCSTHGTMKNGMNGAIRVVPKK